MSLCLCYTHTHTHAVNSATFSAAILLAELCLLSEPGSGGWGEGLMGSSLAEQSYFKRFPYMEVTTSAVSHLDYS